MNEEKKLICDACKKNEAVGVACVPAVAMSCAYCKPCLEANNHPMWILTANTACIGGLDKSADFWREMVMDSLKAQGKTLEWFNAEVAREMAEMDAAQTDAAGALDDFIKETGA
jgi:hypothetical protein